MPGYSQACGEEKPESAALVLYTHRCLPFTTMREIRLLTLPFDNHYLQLGEAFYVKTSPTTVQAPSLIRFNATLADALGIDTSGLNASQLATVFSGNSIPAGAEPVAMAYAGHQFGNFNPALGDGRAILLGEIMAQDGDYYGVQLKGAGRTAFSRNGDGRAALGPVLREYLLSEAMAKLNVPTTRALAAVTTGEPVYRDTVLPGAVITRVAKSFIRIGSFEFFAARDDLTALKTLADYVITRHFPLAAQQENRYVALLQCVVNAQAALIPRWMQLGFIHGVMNTDNVSVVGETIDYGPCAFMDYYQPKQVYSYIDSYGRYAYHKQPTIALWNLARFAEALLPLIANDSTQAITLAEAVLGTFQPQYKQHWLAGMRAKCGLTAVPETDDEDQALIDSLLARMAANHVDFTLLFRALSRLEREASDQDNTCRALFTDPAAFDAWALRWRLRLSKETLSDTQRQASMLNVNPLFIPRNHQVEAVIAAAVKGDFAPFHEMFDVLQNPFTEQAGKERYQAPPQPHEVVENTFCGT